MNYQVKEIIAQIFEKLKPVDVIPSLNFSIQNMSLSVWKMQHDILKLWYDL